jgi:hypothetical protein
MAKYKKVGFGVQLSNDKNNILGYLKIKGKTTLVSVDKKSYLKRLKMN